jgi:plasmid maintenance system antidote protein VapI
LTCNAIWDKKHTMGKARQSEPISNLLRQTIADAVGANQTNFKALERETGVTRASIVRFVAGRQSLRLDIADRLAAYFELELRAKRSKRKDR